METINNHELLGILSARLVHTLSNYMAALSGNLMVLNSTRATKEQKAAALVSVNEANLRSANLLDRFAELLRSARADAKPCPLTNLLEQLPQWSQSHPTWTLHTSPLLGIKPNVALAGPWSWLSFALDVIAGKIGSGPVTLHVAPAQPPRDVRPLEQEPVSYISLIITPAAIDWQEQRENLREWNLSAAYELLNQLGARPQTIETPTGGKQTQIVLPLIQA